MVAASGQIMPRAASLAKEADLRSGASWPIVQEEVTVPTAGGRSELEHVRIGSIVIRCFQFDRMLPF